MASFHRFRPGGAGVSRSPAMRSRLGCIVEPVLLRIQEMAKLLKVSKWTVYRGIEEGRLRATKIGQGSLRVFRTSVRGLIGEAQAHDLDARKNLRLTETRARGTRRKRKK